MVPYFKELDDPFNQTINLIDKHQPIRSIDISQLPLDKTIKYYKLINELDKLNPLMLTKDEENMDFTNYWVDFEKDEDACTILNNYDVEYPLNYYRYGEYDLYNDLKYGKKEFNRDGITNNGFNKIMELLFDYISKHKDDDLEIDIEGLKITLSQYISTYKDYKNGFINFREYVFDGREKIKNLNDKIADYLVLIENYFNVRKGYSVGKYIIFDYIDVTSKLLKMQNRLPKELEDKCNQYINELNKYKFVVPNMDSYVDMKLSNAWFITPYNDLYNTNSYYRGHQNSNIKIDYHKIMKEMTPTLEQLDPKGSLYLRNVLKNNGYFTTFDFRYYFNLIYDCFFIKDYKYLDMDREEQLRERFMYGKCYDQKILRLMIGIESAKASMYEFFYNLRKYSNYYEMELFKIADMSFTDFLVRCCGFHKIETQVDRTITTSLVNYDEAFEEYIKRGWKIEFIPPIVLNDGTLEEYNKDFIKIRSILKN